MFYISSQGHSASGWLSSVLNKHPKLVCWHGTRSIPPGFKDLSEKEFVQSLLQCEQSTFGNKIFGACHGFRGVKLKVLIEKNNGVFLAIIRNPINRVISIFSSSMGAYLTNDILNPDINILEYFSKYEKEINYIFSEIH